MEHENVRNCPAFLGPLPYSPGQPVVTVYEIIVERLKGSKFFQLLKEVIKMTIKGQFVYVAVVSGSQMDKPNFVVKLSYLLLSGTIKASINVHHMTALAKFPSKLPDINTHASRVFRPQFAYGA